MGVDIFLRGEQSAAEPWPAKTYSFDAAGNVTGDGTRTYTYSDRGRRNALAAGGGSVAYLYNALAQRVRKTGTGALSSIGVVDYVYDDAGQLIGEYDGNGPVQETVYLGDMPVAVLKRNATGQMLVNYIFADHLNTPRMIVRASDNKIVWRWVGYDPFGAIQPLEDPAGLGAFVYNLRFPGQVYDKESGLYYNYFRDYDPSTGRYLQSDPIGLKGGINTYGYVRGNPVSYIDPLGLQQSYPGDSPAPRGPIGLPNPSAEAQRDLALRLTRATNWFAQKVKDICSPAKPTPEECKKQWDDARKYCDRLYDSGYRPDKNGKGVGGMNWNQCVAGQVTEDCGGSPIE